MGAEVTRGFSREGFRRRRGGSAAGWPGRGIFPLLLALTAWPGPCLGATPAGRPPVLSIPPRALDAVTGSEFAARTSGMSGRQRQQEALKELRGGKIPHFLRTLKPVRLRYRASDGPSLEATLWVMPDYLAIGSDQDFLRIPLTQPSAIAVAGEFGGILPTRRMVDAIYEQSTCQLKPEPMSPGPRMRSVEYYLTHQRRIETQRGRAGCKLGDLTAGHKKDVVITNRLLLRKDRIAIYGWHRQDGSPIQPLSTVHGFRYADYSHGVRLVSRTLRVNGTPRSVFEVARDPGLAPLITREGVLARIRMLMGLE